MLKRLGALSFLLSLSSTLAYAADTTSPVTATLLYKGEAWHGLSDTLVNSTPYLGNIDLSVNIDLQKTMCLNNTNLLIDIQNLHGHTPFSTLSSPRFFDNIDNPNNFTSLYQLTLTHEFNKQWSVLAGLYDINTEFEVTPSSQHLVNPVFAMNGEMATIGANGPSTYPVNALALKVKYSPREDLYAQAAVLNATAGDPGQISGIHLRYAPQDGLFLLGELTKTFNNKKGEEQGRISLGAWGYTNRTNYLADESSDDPTISDNPRTAHNMGWYILADHPIYQDPHHSERVIHGFLRYGQTVPAVSQIRTGLAVGIAVNSPFIARPNDILSVGATNVWLSPGFQNTDATLPTENYMYEVNYAFAINKYFTLQPIYVFIQNVGGAGSTYKNYQIVGVRGTLTFDLM